MRNKYLLLLGVWLGGLSIATAQNYPSLERFGKNRIQYRNFEWKIVRTANFEIYYYQGGSQIANLTAQYAESEFDRITELLGYTPYNRVKIFLFNSPQELAQSNIGLNAQGGVSSRELDLSKSRVELAFTGDQISFRRQIVRDISMLFVYDMLYGGSLKDALQSSLLLTLPDWFMPGIASYIAEGNSIELDDYMRDVSLTRPVKKPGLLSGAEAERVGHSIWNYIVQKYGRDNVSNILNLTRIIRNEQSSIASTLGIPYNRFLRDWRDYYTGMANAVTLSYQAGADDFQIKIGSANDKVSLVSLKLSPDKQFFAYTVLRDGKFNVEVVNTSTRKKTSILTGGYRLDGQASRTSTPLVAWQRDNNLLVLTDELGKTNLYRFGNFEKRPKQEFRRQVNGLSQVGWMDASEDGGSLILSAERQGQNDLFLYSINRGSYQQLTNDLYDDLYPQFVGRTARTVVFSSNRQADTLGVDKGSYKTVRDQLSLFTHEGTARDLSVVRLTDSLSYATQPIAAGESTLYFLNNTAGVTNLYRLQTDTKAISQLTAFPQSIRLYDLVPANGGFVYSSLKNGDEYIGFRSQLNLTQSVQVPPTQRTRGLTRTTTSTSVATRNAKPAADAVIPADTAIADSTRSTVSTTGRPTTLALEPGEVDTDNYQFDPEVLKAAEYRQRRSGTAAPALSTILPRSRRRENITIRGPFDYKGLFTVNDATSGWRVDPISAKGFGYYQDVTLTDLLENHTLRAGGFITTSLRNTDLFAEYTNQKHRIDYGVRVDRQALFVDASDVGLLQKYRYNRFAVSASYPISVNSRFTVSPFYAITRRIDLATYSEPDRVSDYAGLRGEFVFDNTKVNGMNMVIGTKMKLRFEEYAGLQGASQSFRRLSLDLRHYQKIHRDLVLATRFSFSQSGGAAPKQSTLGGMENWVGSNQKERIASNPLLVPNTVPNEPRTDYRDVFFLDFAGPLRGFRQGKLTGNSYMLFNAELRLPLIRYLYRGNITSNFLRNLQLVAFTDIGTAWTGSGPFSQQNSLNTEIVGGGTLPFRATVTNFKNPFLIGYGAGVRTMLFGYFVKFDYGWGLEDKTISKPIAYLTLGYDF
jgi:Tol biopolymer transport system component